MALESGKDWIAIEVPGDTKNLKVNAKKDSLPNGEAKKSPVPKKLEN